MTFQPTRADIASTVDKQGRAPCTREMKRRGIARNKRLEDHAKRQDLRVRRHRASFVLRDLLAQSQGVEHFTIQGIVDRIEHGGPAASLMLFSIPAIVPIPGTSDLVGPPALAVSSSLVSGRRLRLPPAILQRSVPRRALALAIHAVLPVLERAEKLTKRRWSWLCTPSAQRLIGVLVFLLALPLTFPFLGFGLPHATSLFTIALGMIEKDGVTIALGVTTGIASLVFLTAKGLTPQALARKAADTIMRFARQITSVREVAATILKRAWHWFSVKLMSGPLSRRSADVVTSGASFANPCRLAPARLNSFANESRLASMAAL